MKKETVFVRTKNRNQANMYAEILKKTGETIRPDFNSNTSLNDPDLDYRDSGWILGFSTHGKQEITFGQLIDLLNEPQKIAVHVENEKEFKALMKYYDSLGWKTFHELRVSQVVNVWSNFKYPQSVTYCDGFSSYQKNQLYSDDYQIIPFSEFAAEHHIKLPLLTSEDGVDLYEGDIYFRVHDYSHVGESWLLDASYKLYPNCANLSNKLKSKAFSTKQAALDWIESQKPKEIKLHFGKVVKNCISFNYPCATLNERDIDEIKEAMQKLH